MDELFEYLRSILYEDKAKSLDTDALPEDTRKLGQGMLFLSQCISEMKVYSKSLSIGEISVTPPGKENPLAGSLKNLQASLSHLLWQAQEVAKGDYSQRVDYLGEFSAVFNTMTGQLKRREEDLLNYSHMLTELLFRQEQWFCVVDAKTRKVLYCNKAPVGQPPQMGYCDGCIRKLPIHSDIIQYDGGDEEKVWEQPDGSGEYLYKIHTYSIVWENRRAYAHMIEDITEHDREKAVLRQMAYQDELTKAYNRRYVVRETQKLLDEGKDFSLCYIDIDNLKYVNDNFGHEEGDAYIKRIKNEIEACIRSADILGRIGGDEFVILFPDCPIQTVEEKMEIINNNIKMHLEKKLYPDGFSYGIAFSDEKDLSTVEELLNAADKRMYTSKFERHKRSRTKKIAGLPSDTPL